LKENREPKKRTAEGNKMGFVWIILIFVIWIALQAYILPKMGIRT